MQATEADLASKIQELKLLLTRSANVIEDLHLGRNMHATPDICEKCRLLAEIRKAIYQ
jgi:hypothetical protein